MNDDNGNPTRNPILRNESTRNHAATPGHIYARPYNDEYALKRMEDGR